MTLLMNKTWPRQALLVCSLVLGLTQVGCAHPVVVEPWVSVHSRTGHLSIHAQTGFSGPVMHAPPPRVIYAPPPRVIHWPPPPRVIYVPQIDRRAPAWHHEHDRREGRGDGGRWGHREEHRSHGGHNHWRR